MYVTMTTFLCPFLLESLRLNVKLLWNLEYTQSYLFNYFITYFKWKHGFFCLKQADISIISKQGPNTFYVALRAVHLISYSSQTRSGIPLSLLGLLDSLMIGKVLTKFEKIYWTDIFQGNDLKQETPRVARGLLGEWSVKKCFLKLHKTTGVTCTLPQEHVHIIPNLKGFSFCLSN